LTFSTDASHRIGVQANYGTGRRVNYYPSDDLKPFAVAGRDLSFTLTLRPTSGLKLDEIYLLSTLGGPDGRGEILDSHVLRSRLNYQFTKALSLRAIVDYNIVSPDSQFVAVERGKTLTGDVLLTYLLNPGTAFYIGYTDTRESLTTRPSSYTV